MTKIDLNTLFEKISNYVKETIFSKLPDDLYYHNMEHTTEDVLPQAEELAKREQINDEDLFVLKLAVLFHDTGFIRSYSKNEEIGADLAEATLRKYGIPDKQIENIKQIIMATSTSSDASQHFQMAGDNILEQIICDADLSNLGRSDFFKVSDNLRKELSFHGSTMSDKEWYQHQVELLNRHKYYTRSAKKLLDSGKQNNLKAVEDLLAKL